MERCILFKNIDQQLTGNNGINGNTCVLDLLQRLISLKHDQCTGLGLRKALCRFYPAVSQIKLIDYKVRVLEGTSGTDSCVRVLIESTDGNRTWTTVGVSSDIMEASWLALCDSFEYKLIKDIEKHLLRN